jgi:hypothetical protein
MLLVAFAGTAVARPEPAATMLRQPPASDPMGLPPTSGVAAP